MNEARLRELLREVPMPGAAEAERRGRAMTLAAFEQRPRERRAALPRLAFAAAAAALLAILILSPAGAAVRSWIGDVFTAGVPGAEKALTRVPGGGRLVVRSQAGPWVVQPDGSRRLLGDYREATWSPHGLYLAAVAGRSLTAVEPDGTPHWSLTAPATVRDPRWSPSGYRIAYRAGSELRIVAGDGTGDRLLAPQVAPLAPSWAPGGLPQLAYVDATGELRLVDANSGKRLAAAKALPGIAGLEWGASGQLLELSRHALRLRRIVLDKLALRPSLEAPVPLPLPRRAHLLDAAISPGGGSVAALLAKGSRATARAEVILYGLHSDSERVLFSTPGRLGELSWSPDGRRLLISWPQADQWLFVPAESRGRVKAVAGIGAAFAPGAETGAFPSVEGWCCRR
jgi:dipeptidyl aminopeptidase/acylaminoacyl peptidase